MSQYRKQLNVIYPKSFLVFVFGNPMAFGGDTVWAITFPMRDKKYAVTLYGEQSEKFQDGCTISFEIEQEPSANYSGSDFLASMVESYIRDMVELGKMILLETEVDVSQHKLAILANKPEKEYKFWQQIAEEKIQKLNDIILKNQRK